MLVIENLAEGLIVFRPGRRDPALEPHRPGHARVCESGRDPPTNGPVRSKRLSFAPRAEKPCRIPNGRGRG